MQQRDLLCLPLQVCLGSLHCKAWCCVHLLTLEHVISVLLCCFHCTPQLLEPMQFRSVLLLASDPGAGSSGTGAGHRRLQAASNSSTHASMSAVDSLTLTTLLILRQAQLDQLVGDGEADGPVPMNGSRLGSASIAPHPASGWTTNGCAAADARDAEAGSELVSTPEPARFGEGMTSCYSSPIFEEDEAAAACDTDQASGMTAHTPMKQMGAAVAAARRQGRRLTFEQEWQARIMGSHASSGGADAAGSASDTTAQDRLGADAGLAPSRRLGSAFAQNARLADGEPLAAPQYDVQPKGAHGRASFRSLVKVVVPDLGSRQSSMNTTRQTSFGGVPSRQASMESKRAMLSKSGTLARPSLKIFNEISLDVGLIACQIDEGGDQSSGDAQAHTPQQTPNGLTGNAQEGAGAAGSGALAQDQARGAMPQRSRSPGPASKLPDMQMPELHNALRRVSVVTEVRLCTVHVAVWQPVLQCLNPARSRLQQH